MKTSLKLYLTALVASFLILLGACSTNTNSSASKTESSSSAPTEITIKSSLDEVKLSKVPEKIVTFDLGAADTIRALGFEKKYRRNAYKNCSDLPKRSCGKCQQCGFHG